MYLANDRFLNACRGEPVPVTPIWIMRQAGRYLPQYRALRERHDFLEMCKTPEVAAEITLLPVDILGVDAAILFSDLVIPLEGMGAELRFVEGGGPTVCDPVRTVEQVRDLRVPDPTDAAPFVLETIRLANDALAGRVPLIGFSGAPFTLASYLIEGGNSRDFENTKGWLYREPEGFRELLEAIADTVALFLSAQIEAGVHAVQVFDTWAGSLDLQAYRDFALPATVRLIQRIKRANQPVILFANGCATILEAMAESGADVLSIDWRIPLGEARRRVGGKVALQGNLDPCVLMGPPERISERARAILEEVGDAPGHVFNLGWGVLPATPVEHVQELVRVVHRESAVIRGQSAAAPRQGS